MSLSCKIAVRPGTETPHEGVYLATPPSSMAAFIFRSKKDAAAPIPTLIFHTEEVGQERKGMAFSFRDMSYKLIYLVLNWITWPDLASREPGKCAWLQLGKSATERKEWYWGMHRILCYPTHHVIVRSQVMLCIEPRPKEVLHKWLKSLPPLTPLRFASRYCSC